ncbi:unnamed protein product [Danaus chrysippus]|uniref:(African queen) hypothetical protein n=1 Tax=Danaus chrysippus TaxID=151541 RepID=A0A8J2QI03_9NEOP|nr:unnamed protein product [Danaus chrysippus]
MLSLLSAYGECGAPRGLAGEGSHSREVHNIPEFVILEVQTNIELRFHQQYFMQCTYGWSEEGELTWQLIRALFLYTLPLMLMMVAYWQIVRVLWRSDNISGQIELHQLRANVQTNGFANRRQRIALIHANASTNRQLRSHREAAKMLITVVIMFAMCFFPVHLLCVLRFAYNIQHSDMMTAVALISHVMCYVNAAVNPFIYNFMCGHTANASVAVFVQIILLLQEVYELVIHIPLPAEVTLA